MLYQLSFYQKKDFSSKIFVVFLFILLAKFLKGEVLENVQELISFLLLFSLLQGLNMFVWSLYFLFKKTDFSKCCCY